MKKRISILLGLLLTVSVLASLLVAGTPAAAGTLGWSQEGDPSTTRVIASTAPAFYNIAVAADGLTMYAVASDSKTYKSTNGGLTWAPLTVNAGILATMVAVAPDNAATVAVASATAVYLSTNGGTSWGNVTTGITLGAIYTIDVSPVKGTSNVLAVGGDTGLQFRTISVTGSWGTAITAGGTVLGVFAIKFSPNYAADEAVTVVSANANDAYFEMYSTNTANWGALADLGGRSTGTGTVAVTHAAIALDANFLGSDSTSRLSFYGTNNGVYRNVPTATASTTLSNAINVWSMAWDGTTLVVGQAGTNTVQRSANADESGPTFSASNTAKGPGGSTTATSVALVYNSSGNVIAGTNGASPAMAKSTTSGKAFNDISVVGAPQTAMEDMAISADGSVIYLIADDAATTSSVWRYDATNGWQRILSLAYVATGYKVTVAPANADVVYVTKAAVVGDPASTVYYSKDGGTEKWYTRAAKTVVDLAVESDTILYYTNGTNVFKSTNSAFTWGPPGDTRLSSIVSLTWLSAGNLLAAGSGVAYTTDGNTTWAGCGALSVGAEFATASSLASGGSIYAAKSGAVYRWTVGASTATGTWSTLTTAFAAGTGSTGMAMSSGGALYVSANTPYAERSVAPSGGPGDFILISDTAHLNAATAFSGMALSSATTGNKLWALDGGYKAIWTYTDTLVTVVPTLTAPANGTKISTNALSGNVYTVTCSWPNNTGVTAYSLAFYTDKDCTAQYGNTIAVSQPGPPATATVKVVDTTALGTGFMPGTTYWWRIRASTPLTSAWSAANSFVTDTAGLIVPTPGSPVNGSTITNRTPAFAWSPIAGATSYSLQYSTFATFPDSLTTTVTATTTAYLPPTALDLGTYFWRVKAAAPTPSDWSATSTFTLAAVPTTVAPTTTINVPTQTISIPAITVPTPSVTVVMPETKTTVSPALLWAVIIIGAVLVIALIVLIVRTRRTV